MENLIIKESKYTPEINFNTTEGVLNIKGSSYPENTLEFYEPVLNAMESFFKTTNLKKIVINIEIMYFNSSSSRVFFEIFDLIEDYNDKSEIVINWIYEKDNEGVLEIGEDFKEDFQELNFNIKEKNEI